MPVVLLGPGGGLVVGRTESTPHILVVEDLHLKCEIFLQLPTRKKVIVVAVARGGWLARHSTIKEVHPPHRMDL